MNTNDFIEMLEALSPEEIETHYLNVVKPPTKIEILRKKVWGQVSSINWPIVACNSIGITTIVALLSAPFVYTWANRPEVQYREAYQWAESQPGIAVNFCSTDTWDRRYCWMYRQSQEPGGFDSAFKISISPDGEIEEIK